MFLTSCLIRIGRVALAPFRGFFIISWKELRNRKPRPPASNFWTHARNLVREDFADSLVPFKCATRELRSELRRNN